MFTVIIHWCLFLQSDLAFRETEVRGKALSRFTNNGCSSSELAPSEHAHCTRKLGALSCLDTSMSIVYEMNGVLFLGILQSKMRNTLHGSPCDRTPVTSDSA